MNLEEITEVSGITSAELMNPDSRIPDSAIVGLWRELSARFPERGISMEMAKSVPLSTMGGLAHGAQFAENLGEAIDFIIENRSLLGDGLTLETIESNGEVTFIISHPLQCADGGGSFEVGLGVFWRLFRDLAEPEIHLSSAEVAYSPREGNREAFTEFFGAPVHFDQGRFALTMNADDLKAPVSQANADLFEFAKVHFEQVMQQIDHSRFPIELHQLHQAVIDNATSGEFDTGSAARRANMSVRSAQRLAAQFGSSLQVMIDSVREESAKEFLDDPKVSVDTVATLLGYSDDRAFRRAFKRWTGMTPTQYRRKQ
ncbi:MAG: AraC family transcriptional regulator ligand-binding domain-containing protein [Verrucomicrobiota bacterium]